MRLLQVLVPQVEKICIDKSVYFVFMFMSVLYIFLYFNLTLRSWENRENNCSKREKQVNSVSYPELDRKCVVALS